MSKEYIVKITKNEDATVTLDGSIAWDEFSRFEKVALERLGKHLKIDGFREGHVPEDVAKKNLGDELVLSDMAELAIQEFYPTILKEENIDAIGRPTLSITKMARGNELGFSIRTAVLPEITLPDYKKIASAVAKSTPVSAIDADVDKVIENLRQMRAYGHVHGEGDEHKHEEPLPEVNDEFAKSFGEFKSVDELRAKIKENVNKEKEQEAFSKRRSEILDQIIAETKFAVPDIIIQSEQEKLYAQIEMDISKSGLTMEEYLKHAKKTKEQILEEFKPEAEKHARVQLVVNAIAKKESIAATDEEVKSRADELMKLYPEAQRGRVEAYADMVTTNEKVISMLESSK